MTAELDGYMADAACSVVVPPAAPATLRLVRSADAALARGLAAARAGRPVNDVGRAIEPGVRRDGFTVLGTLTGHGIGRVIHEAPTVPSVVMPGLRDRFTLGLVVTVEPIVSAGGPGLVTDEDGWTIRTSDGAATAHAEHTIVVTQGRPIVLTAA